MRANVYIVNTTSALQKQSIPQDAGRQEASSGCRWGNPSSKMGQTDWPHQVGRYTLEGKRKMRRRATPI